jgi:POT family proton-dependent oligopeptide transporter
MSHKHPIGLWYMSAIYILVAFCFGTINSLLMLFLLHNHLSQAQAYGIFAAFNSMIFTLPVVAGYLSEKMGYRPSTLVGLFFCSIGAWCLALGHGLTAIEWGLAIFAFGLATAGTCSYCIVDMSYSKEDKRREGGFTLFYLLFNIGFLVSTLVGGFLSTHYGYRLSFILAATVVSAALLCYLALKNRFTAAPGRSFEPQVNWSRRSIYISLIAISLIFSLLDVWLLHNEAVNNAVLWLLALCSGIGIIVIAHQQKTARDKKKLFVFLFLCIVSIAFWSLYMLEPSLLTLFIEHSVNRQIGNSRIPASDFYSLDPLYIILFGLVLSRLWQKLGEKNRDLSLASKFALALITMGLGYLVFKLSIFATEPGQLIPMTWIIAGYWFLSIAELLLSPIGLSMVGRLSPDGSEGLLMGIWQLFVGLSAVISGYIGKATIAPASSSSTAVNAVYGHSFLQVGWVAITIGIAVFLLVPKLKQAMQA